MFGKKKKQGVMDEVRKALVYEIQNLEEMINDLRATQQFEEQNAKTGHQVKFVQKNKKTAEMVLVDPVFPDINYPIKAYFNREKVTKDVTGAEVKKMTTVLVFPDGTKVKVSSDTNDESKNAHKGFLVALARRILGTGTDLCRLYDKFETEHNTETMFYGVVMGYFVSQGIVRDAEMFHNWLAEFVATKIEISQKLQFKQSKNAKTKSTNLRKDREKQKAKELICQSIQRGIGVTGRNSK